MRIYPWLDAQSPGMGNFAFEVLGYWHKFPRSSTHIHKMRDRNLPFFIEGQLSEKELVDVASARL